MKKALQKIFLFVAVMTVMGHHVLPHLHHDKISVDIYHAHDQHLLEQQPLDNNEDNQHHVFSFSQLDENFVPASSQNKCADVPLTFLPAIMIVCLSTDLPTIVKPPFGSYKVYPPPEKYFSSSSRRGPPTV
ncbi:hypothetical protein IQ13_3402 [Lacibacter cauensis]|uniref:Uncharacterized protein n=1 Tax=Lacibacter cauensis TaxID=510947 RepID=A0A562SCB7_9BACT|nr:hypothetical protein [Lacibacter cauensis]TWI79011.1 hypothetical protein IQ13_3402 [Lacibacter cauensis]